MSHISTKEETLVESMVILMKNYEPVHETILVKTKAVYEAFYDMSLSRHKLLEVVKTIESRLKY